jgi:hypothetical protein
VGCTENKHDTEKALQPGLFIADRSLKLTSAVTASSIQRTAAHASVNAKREWLCGKANRIMIKES